MTTAYAPEIVAPTRAPRHSQPNDGTVEDPTLPPEDNAPKLNQAVGGRRGHTNPNRAVVNNCPYCGSDYLFPDYETEYAWQCRHCLHVFSVKFHGLLPRDVNK